ncbi:restriction endonuclease subunit S [Escherichia coli]|uniref:restriction endonuclease subunit S n=3 Tax=Escherichia coli TaxID=562 RepID=UPI0007A639A8|nr:restriction endonuclease subunit S [Escherichia coli]MBW1516966.1 restriction endonuclease [Escherichia coli]MCH6716106.1 restriction endonuclease [Escherichia coli]MCK3300796.1 restriction endonuclease subunit S [Escherichia coli]MCK3369099.1 restriction endonuclease subunit S [Escherichia coli]MCK3583715.1 restriction endonuclease subunit S [Escherichia coli]
MSELSYLEKLLDGVEVEWKTLEDISIKISSGGTPKTGVSEFYDGDIPWLRTQEVNFCDIWDTEVKITESGVKNSSAKWIPKNCVIVAMYGATVGKIGINKIPMTTNQACANIQLNEEVAHYRYVFHFLCSQYTYIKSLGTGSQTNINAQIVKNIKIPIPCPDNPEKSLAIQSEIVRILDKFTALTAELTAELTARKKQYNYYRDRLLSFDEGEVEWKALGEVGHIVTGRTPKSSDKSAWGDDVDFVTPSDIKNGMRNITCPSRRLSAEGAASMPKVRIPRGSLLVTCIGADMGKTVINANDCIPNQQINAITLSDDSVQVGYLFHILTAMRETLRRQGELGGGTMPLINKSDFSKIVVPIPSHEEQNRIAKILDKFDTLTNSITEGLPREIELRQKQYEYYRDLLFSFPKPETVSN